MASVEFSDLVTKLRDGGDSFTSADYRRHYRTLSAIEDGPAVRIALMGNITFDLLLPFLTVKCAQIGWQAKTRVGPFAQYFQDLGAAGFRDFAPELIFLHLSLPLLRPEAISRFAELSTAERHELRDGIISEVENWVRLALAASDATLLVSNFPQPGRMAAGIADWAAEYGETEFYLDLNLDLIRRMKPHHRVQIVDVAGAVTRIGADRAADARLLHIAKTDWTDQMMAEIGGEIARHVIAAKGGARKCLVLDLDNTLWGGVLGEDGPAGVKVGQGDPVGEAYLAFQNRVRALKQLGILLAACSKNNPAEVEELFRVRTDMPLQWQDFSATAIGWNAKHVGLTVIADQLNIGLDALVFMDDNPAEIAQMRDALPMVESVLLSGDPSGFVAILDRMPSFEKSRILQEDIQKAGHYAQEASRAAMQATIADPQDYLASLGIIVRLWVATLADLPRLHQMFTKTNQFNVTTPRYSLGELEAMIASRSKRVIVAATQDRFGDMGTIAAYVLTILDDALEIDSFLMSCRAMGRGIETALMNDIKTFALGRESWKAIGATFIATARNQPAAPLFSEQGFTQSAPEDDGKIVYRLNRDDIEIVETPWISVIGA